MCDISTMPTMHVHRGVRVIAWSGQAAALWVKYTSFSHVNYNYLKRMNVIYRLLRVPRMRDPITHNKQGAPIGHVRNCTCVIALTWYFTLNFDRQGRWQQRREHRIYYWGGADRAPTPLLCVCD